MVSLVSAENTALVNVAIINSPSLIAPEIEGIEFPIGFADFQVEGLEPGQATTISLILPETTNDQPYSTYWIYSPEPNNPEPHWYEFLFDGLNLSIRTEIIILTEWIFILLMVKGEIGI